jgi:uncharacterized membrane protein
MFSRLRRYFISGLIVFLPLTLTAYLFVWTVNFADNILGKFIQPYFKETFGFYFDGLGIVVGVWLIVIIGFLATNFFGRKLHDAFEKMILKLPFFRQVYPAIKEMALFLFSRERLRFKQVVIVEYPRKGVYAFGFLTNEQTTKRACDKVGKDLCNVFLPSSPSPVTGFVLMVPRKELIPTDVSVEEAIKFNVSGGVVNPFSYV